MPGVVGPTWQSVRAGLTRRGGDGRSTRAAAARPSASTASPRTVLRTTGRDSAPRRAAGPDGMRKRARISRTTPQPRRLFAGDHFAAPGLNENFAVAVAFAPLPTWTVTVRVP